MFFNINSTRGQTRFLACIARVTCLAIHNISTFSIMFFLVTDLKKQCTKTLISDAATTMSSDTNERRQVIKISCIICKQYGVFEIYTERRHTKILYAKLRSTFYGGTFVGLCSPRAWITFRHVIDYTPVQHG